MAHISIDLLYKVAEEFEEGIPPTLPAGREPEVKNKPAVEVQQEEAPLSARFLFQRDMSAETLKELMGMLSEIHNLTRGAAGLLRSMNKGLILHPTSGIDAFLGPMNEQMDKINLLVGRPK